jgi:hypothetical protein
VQDSWGAMGPWRAGVCAHGVRVCAARLQVRTVGLGGKAKDYAENLDMMDESSDVAARQSQGLRKS